MHHRNSDHISNLALLSKILECVASHQMGSFSATAPVTTKVTASLTALMDHGYYALLTLLDISIAFVTVDHSILEFLIEYLSRSFAVSGCALVCL